MNLKDFLVEWNNQFPLDKRFRNRNNISFNSIEHRQTNQIDILINFYEDVMFNRFFIDYESSSNFYKSYKETGELFRDDIEVGDVEHIDQLFDDIPLDD